MTYDINIGIVGGDRRNLLLAEIFANNGYNVLIAGHNEIPANNQAIVLCSDVADLTKNADIMIFGLPAMKEHGVIYTPLYDGEILLEELFYNINPNIKVHGGKLTREIISRFEKHGIRCIDYCECDKFAWLNAVSTAEGCINIIMENLDRNIDSLPCLVIGYGRIGKLLAKKLKLLGARVTVSARRRESLNEASGYGFETLLLNDMVNCLNRYEVIINTVPALILNKERLIGVSDKLIIDLASYPGGTDFEFASMNNKTIHALSLPGKYSPYSAAETIFKVITEEA